MSHHGWIAVTGTHVPTALLSPFGRLFPARGLSYSSHAISLLAGAHGPLEERILRDPDGNPIFKDGEVKTVQVFRPGDPNKPSENQKQKPSLPAGFTFLGQFIDHDMTEFRVATRDLGILQQNPTIGQRQIVHEDGEPTTTNGRSGRIDLDSVYGLLGSVELKLFDPDGKFKYQAKSGIGYDIIRDVDYRDGRLIADPRNDENKLIVQLHIIFERLHNKIHDGTANAPDDVRKVEISRTQDLVANAFRRILIYDYLPRVVGVSNVLAVWSKIKTNTSFYQKMNRRLKAAVLPMLEALTDGVPAKDGKPSKAPEDLQAFLDALVATPVEFSHAAFRLGHTQLRDAYMVAPGKIVPLFATGPYGEADTASKAVDLRGNMAITADTQVDWALFFGAKALHGRPLDANLPTSIFRLPPPSVGEPPISLAERNIRRGVDFGLPSGQEAALILASTYGDDMVPVLSPEQILPKYVLDQFPEMQTADAQFAVSTPLWFYILREASVFQPDQPYLGPVGGIIVAETLLGVLSASKTATSFSLADYLDGEYEAEVEKAAKASTVDQHVDIRTMQQLLNFIGSAV